MHRSNVCGRYTDTSTDKEFSPIFPIKISSISYKVKKKPQKTEQNISSDLSYEEIRSPKFSFTQKTDDQSKSLSTEFICGRWFSSTGDDLKNAFSRPTIQFFLLYNAPFLLLKSQIINKLYIWCNILKKIGFWSIIVKIDVWYLSWHIIEI
jgi:hypothetical protein